MPPPTTMSPTKATTLWPGATKRWGRSHATAQPPSGASSMRASAGVPWAEVCTGTGPDTGPSVQSHDSRGVRSRSRSARPPTVTVSDSASTSST